MSHYENIASKFASVEISLVLVESTENKGPYSTSETSVTIVEFFTGENEEEAVEFLNACMPSGGPVSRSYKIESIESDGMGGFKVVSRVTETIYLN